MTLQTIRWSCQLLASSLRFLPAPCCCCCCWWIAVLLAPSVRSSSPPLYGLYMSICLRWHLLLWALFTSVYSICHGLDLLGALNAGWGEQRLPEFPTIMFNFNDESGSDLNSIIQMFLHYLLACSWGDLLLKWLDQLRKSQWGEWWEKMPPAGKKKPLVSLYPRILSGNKETVNTRGSIPARFRLTNPNLVSIINAISTPPTQDHHVVCVDGANVIKVKVRAQRAFYLD